jgi:hypothetical protein
MLTADQARALPPPVDDVGIEVISTAATTDYVFRVVTRCVARGTARILRTAPQGRHRGHDRIHERDGWAGRRRLDSEPPPRYI